MINFKGINTQAVSPSVSLQIVKLPKITSEEAKEGYISLFIEHTERMKEEGKIPDIPVIDAKKLIKERRV